MATTYQPAARGGFHMFSYYVFILCFHITVCFHIMCSYVFTCFHGNSKFRTVMNDMSTTKPEVRCSMAIITKQATKGFLWRSNGSTPVEDIQPVMLWWGGAGDELMISRTSGTTFQLCAKFELSCQKQQTAVFMLPMTHQTTIPMS